MGLIELLECGGSGLPSPTTSRFGFFFSGKRSGALASKATPEIFSISLLSQKTNNARVYNLNGKVERAESAFVERISPEHLLHKLIQKL